MNLYIIIKQLLYFCGGSSWKKITGNKGPVFFQSTEFQSSIFWSDWLIRAYIWYWGQVFEQCCRQRATRWDTRPNLKYPARNSLPILNRKVPKQHNNIFCLKNHYVQMSNHSKNLLLILVENNQVTGFKFDVFDRLLYKVFTSKMLKSLLSLVF